MTTTTEAMRLALEALEQVRKQADSANGICHLYEGDCPDPGQPDARDAGCPACKTIDASDAAIAALRDALASAPVAAHVALGPFLFQFASFHGWVNGAQQAWRSRGVRSEHTLCLDAAGRICRIGRDFMTAHDEGTFPVRVYLMREDMQPAAPKD